MAYPTIIWFRQDLRLSDNPALRAAADRGGPVLPVFIWAPDEQGDWPPGAASQVYLHHALASLRDDLADKGLPLIVRRTDDTADELAGLAADVGAGAVCFNRCYEPAARRIEQQVRHRLARDGIEVDRADGSLLYQPEDVATKNGDPYKVFTPYWRAAQELAAPRPPQPAPRKDALAPPRKQTPQTLAIDDLGLLPDHPWADGVIDGWPIGETAARRRMQRFCRAAIFTYQAERDRPDLDATSQLSPHLHFGAISPHQAWAAALEARANAPDTAARKSCDAFLRELGWREFSYHLLYHFPHTPTRNLNEKFDDFPWADNDEHLERWQAGLTGYPIVDAGLRQLWGIGWMHNRLRMIVASFLTKDLRLHWLAGARWFWDTLIDADLASNTQGWQWAGGCGADAQPYFRIFNPHLQAEKFDPDGAFVRKWCPELADVPDRFLHEPRQWADDIDYPEPIVDHSEARDEALAAFEKIKGK